MAAETRRLHEAEDSRIAQSLYRLGQHALRLFCCECSFFDLRTEVANARKDLRKVRADSRWSMNAHGFRMHVPFLPMADTAQPVISPFGGTGCYALVQKNGGLPAAFPFSINFQKCQFMENWLTSAERHVAHLERLDFPAHHGRLAVSGAR